MTLPVPDLRDATVRLLDALLSSAETDVIGVANWWPRATAALEAAATAATYGEAVTIATRKLQIDAYSAGTSTDLTHLEGVIGSRMGEWSELVASEAPYLVALTRAARKSRRKPSPAASVESDPKELF